MKPLHLAVVGLVLLSSDCATRDRFRYVQSQPTCFDGKPDPLPGAPDEKRLWASLDCGHELYNVGYVEFDSDGKMFDPQQLEKALKLVEHARGKGPDGKVITVVYVHGWKNNASAAAPGGKPKDVERFQTALVELGSRSKEAQRKLGDKPPPVVPIVGIYMAWRGKSLKGPSWFTFLSYWGRRNTANRVGDGADFGPALNRIIDKVNEGATGSRVLLVGHSFGARVLEHAIEKQQVRLYTDVAGSDAKNPRVDLALYVNSANDARLSAIKVSALRQQPLHVRHPDYNEGDCKKTPGAQACREYPLQVAITSRGDLATKYLLPTANTLNPDRGSAPDPVVPAGNYLDRTPGRGAFRKAAAAHLTFLQSHVIHEIPCPAPVELPVVRLQSEDERIADLVKKTVAETLKDEKLLAEVKAAEDKKALEAFLRAEAAKEAIRRPACPADDPVCRFAFRAQGERTACFQADQRAGTVRETPATTAAAASRTVVEPFNTTAFWIMDVDTTVIKDHGDIWNLSFVEMLGQLMAPRGFFEPGPGRIKIQAAKPGAP